MSQAVKCLILLAVVALLFVTELIPLAITATAGAISCGLLGFIPAKQVFSGLSDSTVVLFAAKIPASRQLMPLAFACGWGGIITMVGTPPNIIAVGAMTSAGLEPFGFFEFAWIGIPVSIAGMLYMMFVGKYLLPKVDLSADQEIEQEIEAASTSSTKQIISGVILALVIITMAVGIPGVSLEIAAITGALVCVLTGCLTEKQAYASIDWVTIFLFAGMMPVSNAMDKTGAGKLIAEWAVSLMGGSPTPIIMTSVLFIISCTLTQFMSNTAAAALLAPVGVAISQQLGASPKAVLMAIGVAASCAFATPVGTPPCTLVLGPGGYKFMDYVKVGVPLVILCFIVSIIVIPMVWPFFPG